MTDDCGCDAFASLCILSYNRPEFIEQTIRSAIATADHPMEVIVHDDGSDDQTRKLLLALQDEGLISTLLLNQTGHNEGQGIALNRMFRIAKGDPIIKCDHDLIFTRQGWLRQAVTILGRNYQLPTEPRIGALGLFKYWVEPVIATEKHIADFDGWESHEDFVGSLMVIPRDAYEKFGPFEERSEAFAEDFVFKNKVTEDPNWCCALTSEDFVRNQGFGVGPSTVVVQKEDGSLTSRDIVKGPKLV